MNADLLRQRKMQRNIEKINRINTDVLPFEHIKNLYRETIEGVSLVAGTTKGHEIFFRSRINPPKRPQCISELGAPPASVITGYQRCNAPHVSMFYSSSRRITSILECRPKSGDLVYLGQWIAPDQVPVNKIFDPSVNEDFFLHASSSDQIFYAYLDTLFTRRIHATFSSDYKLSAAISELLTTNFPANDREKIQLDGTVGLRYPSVLDLQGSYNTVFHKISSERRLKLLHVMEMKVREASSNVLEFDVLDTALDFENDIINWTGDNSKLPAMRGGKGAVPFMYESSKFKLLTISAEPTREVMDLLLNE